MQENREGGEVYIFRLLLLVHNFSVNRYSRSAEIYIENHNKLKNNKNMKIRLQANIL